VIDRSTTIESKSSSNNFNEKKWELLNCIDSYEKKYNKEMSDLALAYYL
jgi:hypothetical protein